MGMFARIDKLGLNGLPVKLMSLDQFPLSLDTDVANWVSRVISNGGGDPTRNTKIAVNDFVLGLKADGIFSQIVAASCLVPDSLIASITPIIKVAGNDPWTNSNFVGSDLTIAGLKGNGGNKTLDTGVNISSGNFSLTSIGMTLYAAVTPTVGFDSLQDAGGGANDFGIITNLSGVSFFDCFNNTGGQGRISGSSQGAGYYSGNRIASNNTALYYASSTSTHAPIATSTGNGGSFPNFLWPLFTGATAGSPNNGCDVRLSFAAIHSGLTSTNSSNLFSRVQTFRHTLGGGFV